MINDWNSIFRQLNIEFDKVCTVAASGNERKSGVLSNDRLIKGGYNAMVDNGGRQKGAPYGSLVPT